MAASTHSTMFWTTAFLGAVTVSWSEIRRDCPACSLTDTLRTGVPASCGSPGRTSTFAGRTVVSGTESPDTSPAAAGCAENPTAEASSATAADTTAIRPATDQAHTIPALTDIPRPSRPRPACRRDSQPRSLPVHH